MRLLLGHLMRLFDMLFGVVVMAFPCLGPSCRCTCFCLCLRVHEIFATQACHSIGTTLRIVRFSGHLGCFSRFRNLLGCVFCFLLRLLLLLLLQQLEQNFFFAVTELITRDLRARLVHSRSPHARFGHIAPRLLVTLLPLAARGTHTVHSLALDHQAIRGGHGFAGTFTSPCCWLAVSFQARDFRMLQSRELFGVLEDVPHCGAFLEQAMQLAILEPLEDMLHDMLHSGHMLAPAAIEVFEACIVHTLENNTLMP